MCKKVLFGRRYDILEGKHYGSAQPLQLLNLLLPGELTGIP